jgi:Rieske Fe-S protein
MDRRNFLESLGIGAAFVLTSSCLQSCKKTIVGNLVDFSLDLNASENAALQNNGGYVIKNAIVIARDKNGNFVAASQTCGHQQFKTVVFQENTNEFFCTTHGARYDTAGKGLNDVAKTGIFTYKTELKENQLRIYEA